MAKKNHSVLDFYDVESPYVTEFNRLLHRIIKVQKKRDIKSIMMTSAMLSEGKSTITSFMGITAAVKQGLKTLIMDCDLRRPTISNFFKIPSHPGVIEILSDAFNPREAIVKTKINKLDLLPSGAVVSNPSEVFDPEAIGHVVEELKFYYDLILVDTPPLIPVSDPMLLASKVDGILLVIKSGATQKEVVQRAVEILSEDERKILGIVLNNVTESLPFHYNYNYYNYEYTNKAKSAQKAPGKSRTLPKKQKNNSRDFPLEENITENK